MKTTGKTTTTEAGHVAYGIYSLRDTPLTGHAVYGIYSLLDTWSTGYTVYWTRGPRDTQFMGLIACGIRGHTKDAILRDSLNGWLSPIG